MATPSKLPPGQHAISTFPRFGLAQFANRFPAQTTQINLRIAGDVEKAAVVADQLRELPRVNQTSDFHCVTTWTRCSLQWSGFRFADFFERLVVPLTHPPADATFVIFRCQDGYATSLPLADLLAPTCY